MADATSRAPVAVLAEEDNLGLFSGRAKIIIAAAVLIGALGYFAFMAFQSATVYYYTVSEMKELGPTPQGKLVRVNGKLVPVSFQRQDDSTLATFSLTDGDTQIDAVHDGVLPDLLFNGHSEIILEGSYELDGVFSSRNVIVKCPSKYIALEDAAGDDQSSWPEMHNNKTYQGGRYLRPFLLA